MSWQKCLKCEHRLKLQNSNFIFKHNIQNNITNRVDQGKGREPNWILCTEVIAVLSQASRKGMHRLYAYCKFDDEHKRTLICLDQRTILKIK